MSTISGSLPQRTRDAYALARRLDNLLTRENVASEARMLAGELRTMLLYVGFDANGHEPMEKLLSSLDAQEEAVRVAEASR